jgi:hypothetical protein
MRIYGVDFTSAPRQAKPITCASCVLHGDALRLARVDGLDSFAAFEALLARPGPWVGGFDFPFGQPRQLIAALGLPTDWPECTRQVAALSADTWRRRIAAFRDTRPPGDKEPPRLTDRLRGAQSAMKCVNPPVALMYRAGAPRLLAAGLNIQPCCASDDERTAIETYPALLARTLIGRRPYKSDNPAQQDHERAMARRTLIEGLSDKTEKLLGLRLSLSQHQRRRLQADARGDRLDALLCAIQAAWAWQQPGLGMPVDADTLEGWIPWPERP